jgi:hypothetical protein
MRSLATPLLLLAGLGPAPAQTPPDKSGTAPLTRDGADLRDAAQAGLDLLAKQNALLSQILAQSQRGLVTYPIALALPGPINCLGNCRATVAAICQAVKYPNSYSYPATVPADAVGLYANGVCYGP